VETSKATQVSSNFRIAQRGTEIGVF